MNEVFINNRSISSNNEPYIIAELSVSIMEILKEHLIVYWLPSKLELMQ